MAVVAAPAAHEAVARSMRDLIEARLPGADRLVVDIACGEGLMLRGLHPRLRRIGVDYSAEVLVRARSAFGGLACSWVRADARRLPLRGGSVDLVSLMSAWWVLPDLSRCLAETIRVLRPGGVLAVHSWAPAGRCRLITIGASAIGARLPAMIRPPGVIGPFDVDSARIAGAAIGLSVEQVTEHEYRWPIGALTDYWAQFAILAPTSFAAYRAADPEVRAAVDALVGRLLSQARTREEEVGLQWNLMTLRK